MIVEKKTAVLIGTLSFARKRGPWELSLQIRRDRWGQGLAREAAQAALEWFWKQRPDVERVIAISQTENTRCIRLLQSIGTRLEREYEWKTRNKPNTCSLVRKQYRNESNLKTI